MTQVGHTIPIQRVEAFVQLARLRGWNVDAMMIAAGVSPSLLSEGRSRVTGDQATALAHQLWRATNDELLGFGSAPVPPGTLRMLCFALLLGSPELGQALDRFDQFERALPGIPPISVDVDGSAATLTIDISGLGEPLDLLVDSLLAATHRTLGWAIGTRIRLQQVHVPHPRPANVDDYDVIFGAPVVFGASAPALLFDAAVLSAPILRSHDEIDAFLRNAPGEILARRDYGIAITDRVRRILRPGPDGNWPDADQIARQLAMSPQTLRRKLRDEDTSLSRIRDHILRDIAVTSLANGHETIAALSARLGFSEPSAFTRAFRRWTGHPPRAYRPAALGEGHIGGQRYTTRL